MNTFTILVSSCGLGFMCSAITTAITANTKGDYGMVGDWMMGFLAGFVGAAYSTIMSAISLSFTTPENALKIGPITTILLTIVYMSILRKMR